MKQKHTPLFDAVNRYIAQNPAYFRIPGHRYERGISEKWRNLVGDAIFRYDLTETPLLDDLHNPSAAIQEAEGLAAELFGADHSFFLVNGTSCGNEAMLLANFRAGDKVAIARNAHKSALSGLILSGVTPVYLMPEYSERLGAFGSVTPETVGTAFLEHPDIKGVMIVSPSYYGVCSDLGSIARICHDNGAILMVDEAHGAHFYFSELLPEGALRQGADMCAQSIHKTAGSLTQSSVLHMKSALVDVGRVRSALRLVQSTSPSYLLMTSLDLARHELAERGEEMCAHAIFLAEQARREISALGLRCLGREELTKNGGAANRVRTGFSGGSAQNACAAREIFDYDPTRLVINVSALGSAMYDAGGNDGSAQIRTAGNARGISGYELADRLFYEHNVDTELSDPQNVVAVVTFANTEHDIKRLVNALAAIVHDYEKHVTVNHLRESPPRSECELRHSPESSRPEYEPRQECESRLFPALPPQRLTPREAYFAPYIEVAWQDAVGRVAAESLSPYPPGIPLICPGEILTQEIWDYLELQRRAKRSIHGPADAALNSIRVIA